MVLEGKVAMVTASSRGIGLEIARYFSREGAKVAMTSRKLENVSRAAEQIGAFPIQAHAGDPDQAGAAFEACLKHFGRLDILVNNAASNPSMGPVHETPLELWGKILGVGLTGNFLMSQLAARHFIASATKGVILNIASIAGLGASPLLGAYGAAKAGLISLTKTMAVELAGYGIRVNTIAPGIVRTRFAGALVDMFEAGQSAANPLLSIPLGRVGEASEVAELALFLASDKASYITGGVYPIDGGSSA